MPPPNPPAFDDAGEWIGTCSKCHTSHDGYPPGTLGGDIRCVRAQAAALGATGLVEAIDRDMQRWTQKQDEMLRRVVIS
jgi:hypothetical protein